MREPGDRTPAPGQLALVQAFLNTHYDLGAQHGGEVFSDPAALGVWFSRHDLAAGARPTGGDLEWALELRQVLRDVLDARQNELVWARLDRAAEGTYAAVSFTAGEPQFMARPADGVSGALGAILAIVALAMRDGSWFRLKICPGSDCEWVFYDHSRNQSGRWCSMSICGGRAKARAHYWRRRGEGGS